jgi:hypothetical protein
MEQSETIILGILGILDHFSHLYAFIKLDHGDEQLIRIFKGVDDYL